MIIIIPWVLHHPIMKNVRESTNQPVPNFFSLIEPHMENVSTYVLYVSSIAKSSLGHRDHFEKNTLQETVPGTQVHEFIGSEYRGPISDHEFDCLY